MMFIVMSVIAKKIVTVTANKTVGCKSIMMFIVVNVIANKKTVDSDNRYDCHSFYCNYFFVNISIIIISLLIGLPLLSFSLSYCVNVSTSFLL